MLTLNGPRDYRVLITTGASQSFRAHAQKVTTALELETTLKNFGNRLYMLTSNYLGTANKRVVKVSGSTVLMPIGGSAKMGVDLTSDDSVERYLSIVMKAMGDPSGIVREAISFRINASLYHLYVEIYGKEAAKESRFFRKHGFNLKLSKIDVKLIGEQAAKLNVQ